MITSFLPTFKVFEVNNLVGLRNGHILAQMKADVENIAKVTAANKVDYVENGIIVGLDADGTISNYDPAKHDMPFVHYTEEILTWLPELRLFACPIEDGVVYPRAIGLYVGDTFTTNNHVAIGEEADRATYKYAKVTNGVLELQTAADKNTMFKATDSSLPDGSEAFEFQYYRKASVAG
jgi:hypothetical protein